MAKPKGPRFHCIECTEKSLTWLGQCPACKSWNSLEEISEVENSNVKAASATNLDSKLTGSISRFSSGLSEFDRLLGGGVVPGSVILLGGEPGIGKSTFLLNLAESGQEVLYVSGEESIEQIATRAKRLEVQSKNLNLVYENSLAKIMALLRQKKHKLVFIDSIQTLHSGSGFAGSISQVKESAQTLLEWAKASNAAVIITGHITKDGQIAGPKLLEHAVDIVLYFESHGIGSHRLIRASKNRFGSTGEVALFEMTSKGLKQVENNGALISLDEVGGVGSVLFPQLEGSRILPVEIQVLVTPTGFSNGRRIGEGLDNSKIYLAAAILEKFLNLKLSQCDIYVKIKGSSKIHDSASDLALIIAMASSYLDKAMVKRWSVAGEVSLTGRISNPSQMYERVQALYSLKVPFHIWGGSRIIDSHISKLINDKSDSFISDIKDIMTLFE